MADDVVDADGPGGVVADEAQGRADLGVVDGQVRRRPRGDGGLGGKAARRAWLPTPPPTRRDGRTRFHAPPQASYRDLHGHRVVDRTRRDGRLRHVVIHCFADGESRVVVPVGEGWREAARSRTTPRFRCTAAG